MSKLDGVAHCIMPRAGDTISTVLVDGKRPCNRVLENKIPSCGQYLTIWVTGLKCAFVRLFDRYIALNEQDHHLYWHFGFTGEVVMKHRHDH